jgi:hypothetical protein
LWSFCTFFPFWYVWTKNNLATPMTTVPTGKSNQKVIFNDRRIFQVSDLRTSKW